MGSTSGSLILLKLPFILGAMRKRWTSSVLERISSCLGPPNGELQDIGVLAQHMHHPFPEGPGLGRLREPTAP